MRVAVLGATGAVGLEMWRLLEESPFALETVVPYTSERSAGTVLAFRGSPVACRALEESSVEAFDLVLASAGAETARGWGPRLAARGAVVVDNSSAFRQDPAVPLVVPEVNGRLLDTRCSMVANPNCSTIQMVMALAPLHAVWGLRAVRVATYQSVSGAGARAVDELRRQSGEALEDRPSTATVFPHPIAFNVLPEIGEFGPDGESREEVKMREESRRILDLPELALAATCARVPVFRGHSEAVWASFESTPDPVEARVLLEEAGLVLGEGSPRAYPFPLMCAGSPEVFVGRVRRDPVDPRGLCLWVVADNLLKGAATNAFQIASILVRRGLVPRRTS